MISRVLVSKKLQACLGPSLIGGLIFCVWCLLAGLVVLFHVPRVGIFAYYTQSCTPSLTSYVHGSIYGLRPSDNLFLSYSSIYASVMDSRVVATLVSMLLSDYFCHTLVSMLPSDYFCHTLVSMLLSDYLSYSSIYASVMDSRVVATLVSMLLA